MLSEPNQSLVDYIMNIRSRMLTCEQIFADDGRLAALRRPADLPRSSDHTAGLRQHARALSTPVEHGRTTGRG